MSTTEHALTLRGAFEEYYRRHASLRRKTAEELRHIFERTATPLADRLLSDIKPCDAEELHWQVKEQRGPYAANRCLQLLRAVYNRVERWGLYDGRNPFRSPEKFPEKPRKRRLETNEVDRLVAVAREYGHRDLYDFIRLALWTGKRKSEILSMRWCDLNLKRGVWNFDNTKNGEDDLIHLGEHEIELLVRRWQPRQEFVFHSPDSKIGHIHDLKKPWAVVCRLAGFSDLHIHDLRRTVASQMADCGVTPQVVQGAMNHRDPKTTALVYTHTHKDTELAGRKLARAQWQWSEAHLQHTSAVVS